MQDEQENLEINLESKPAKRGRKPKTETSDSAEPKKKGRKAKNVEQASESVSETPTQNNDASEPAYVPAPYDPHSEPAKGDDFAYARSDYDDEERSSNSDSEEVPERFSTDDGDLVHDNYSANASDEQASGDGFSASENQAQNQQSMQVNPERHQHNQHNRHDRHNRNKKWKNNQNNHGNNPHNQNRNPNQQNRNQQQNRNNNQNNNNQNRNQQKPKKPKWMQGVSSVNNDVISPADLPETPLLKDAALLEAYLNENYEAEKVLSFDEIYKLNIKELAEKLRELGVENLRTQNKSDLVAEFFKFARLNKSYVRITGVLDVFEDGFGGAVCFENDSYELRKNCPYVSQSFIEANSLQRGHTVEILAVAPRADGQETCPIAVKLISVMGREISEVKELTPFSELTAYYPTTRMIMEVDEPKNSETFSMRVVDLLTPMGLGQRALIVAPPRTGKTVLMQGIAKSIRRNTPEAHLIILLVDERPEEVTDFKRNVDAEIISSTFDEDAFSHVHAAEMVISRARRMVEVGQDVVILLDSITRLARAYNAMMPNSGKILSGGVEANALQKPKRFFGSARNIENGGSLTIIGTALVETGSKMDDVIFEEFKGTGNCELHLDRSLVDKRIFPAINLEKSGTRKEELLYHQDEMAKIYSLRRAMKGVPSTEAMELLISRLKKVKTNIEFLMSLNR